MLEGFKDFYFLLRLIFPSFLSFSFLLLIMTIGVSFSYEIVGYHVGLISSQYYTVLPTKSKESFISLSGYALGMVIFISCIVSVKKLMVDILNARSRSNITKRLQKYYMIPSIFKYINTKYYDRNIDQIICTELNEYCRLLINIICNFITTPSMIVYYTVLCYTSSGAFGIIMSYIYFVFFSVISIFTIILFAKFIVYLAQKESNYRNIQSIIHSCDEVITMSNGLPFFEEMSIGRLVILIKTQISVAYKGFFVKIVSTITSYIGGILSYLAIGGYYLYYTNLTPDATTISKMSYYSMYLIYLFSQLIALGEDIGKIMGLSRRLHLIRESIEMNDIPSITVAIDGKKNKSGSQLDIKDEKSPLLVVKELDVNIPHSTTVLIKKLTFSAFKNGHLLITGMSGCGKSTLIKLICNFWDVPDTAILRYLDFTSLDVIVLTNSSSSCMFGNIFQQVVYPSIVSDHSNDSNTVMQVMEALKKARLTNFADPKIIFDDSVISGLSSGEAQKIGFARIFFHKPSLAIFDEASNGIPSTDCKELLLECFHQGTTAIFISHNFESLVDIFPYRLIINPDTSWTLNSKT